jgi:hypothetical protein
MAQFDTNQLRVSVRLKPFFQNFRIIETLISNASGMLRNQPLSIQFAPEPGRLHPPTDLAVK